MGAAAPGMARALAGEPSAASVLAEFGAASGVDVARAACEGDAAELFADRVWELAVVATEAAAAAAYRARGASVSGALGFSIGAYAALWCAGALSARQVVTMIDVVLAGSRALDGTFSMAAITGPSLEAVEARCRRGAVEVSAVLAPGQTVVAGREEAVAGLVAAAAPSALRVTPIAVRWPLHTTMMASVAALLERSRAAVGELRPLRHPVYSGVDGARITDPREGWELLVQHLVRPQRFDVALAAALADAFERVVELGPGTTLSRLARRSASRAVSVDALPGAAAAAGRAGDGGC